MAQTSPMCSIIVAREIGTDEGGNDHGTVGTAEQGEHGFIHLNGEADPGSLADFREIHHAAQACNRVGTDNTQQDRDDLDHAFSPDIADDDHGDRDDRDAPVRIAVIDS